MAEDKEETTEYDADKTKVMTESKVLDLLRKFPRPAKAKHKEEMSKSSLWEFQVTRMLISILRSKGLSLAHGGLLWGILGLSFQWVWKKVEPIQHIPVIQNEMVVLRETSVTKIQLIELLEYCQQNEIAPEDLSVDQINFFLRSTHDLYK